MFIGRSANPYQLRSEDRNSTRALLLQNHSAPPNGAGRVFCFSVYKHVTPDGMKPVDSLRTNDVETTVTVWTETIHLMLRLQPTRLQPVSSATVSPAAVHHRENPQFIYDGFADVAPMYFHFGEYLKKRMPEHFDYVALPAEGNFRDELAVSMLLLHHP